jgi:hypothetical protein
MAVLPLAPVLVLFGKILQRVTTIHVHMTEAVRPPRSTNLTIKEIRHPERADAFLFTVIAARDKRPLVGFGRVFLIQCRKWVFCK